MWSMEGESPPFPHGPKGRWDRSTVAGRSMGGTAQPRWRHARFHTPAGPPLSCTPRLAMLRVLPSFFQPDPEQCLPWCCRYASVLRNAPNIKNELTLSNTRSLGIISFLMYCRPKLHLYLCTSVRCAHENVYVQWSSSWFTRFSIET